MLQCQTCNLTHYLSESNEMFCAMFVYCLYRNPGPFTRVVLFEKAKVRFACLLLCFTRCPLLWLALLCIFAFARVVGCSLARLLAYLLANSDRVTHFVFLSFAYEIMSSRPDSFFPANL
jgi:hypothetical protein